MPSSHHVITNPPIRGGYCVVATNERRGLRGAVGGELDWCFTWILVSRVSFNPARVGVISDTDIGAVVTTVLTHLRPETSDQCPAVMSSEAVNDNNNEMWIKKNCLREINPGSVVILQDIVDTWWEVSVLGATNVIIKQLRATLRPPAPPPCSSSDSSVGAVTVHTYSSHLSPDTRILHNKPGENAVIWKLFPSLIIFVSLSFISLSSGSNRGCSTSPGLDPLSECLQVPASTPPPQHWSPAHIHDLDTPWSPDDQTVSTEWLHVNQWIQWTQWICLVERRSYYLVSRIINQILCVIFYTDREEQILNL